MVMGLSANVVWKVKETSGREGCEKLAGLTDAAVGVASRPDHCATVNTPRDAAGTSYLSTQAGLGPGWPLPHLT